MENINNTNTNENIFCIHESFFPEVEKKINKVIKKCKKCGNDFTFEVVGIDMREDSRARDHKQYEGVFHKFIIVNVEGEAKVGDWEFIATLNIRSNGNVIRRYNNEVEIPDYYKTSPDVCDHCNSVRNRKNLYLVRNVETGEFKQVGGNCLMSYTGISLEHAAAIMDGIDHLCRYDNIYDNEFSCGRTHYYSVKDVIWYASVIIGKMGYFNVESSLPTRWLVSDMLLSETLDRRVKELNDDLAHNGYGNVAFCESEFEYDESKVNAIIDYYMSLDDDSEFVHNIQTIMADGYATYKDLGFLSYAPQGYAKHIQREIERAKRDAWKRKHWGEIGKRYKNVPVQDVRSVAGFCTDYGYMNIWQIVIEDGTVLTWKSCSYPEDEVSTVSFTVKEHGEYNGIPQTVVTRCKFASLYDVA